MVDSPLLHGFNSGLILEKNDRTVLCNGARTMYIHLECFRIVCMLMLGFHNIEQKLANIFGFINF